MADYADDQEPGGFSKGATETFLLAERKPRLG